MIFFEKNQLDSLDALQQKCSQLTSQNIEYHRTSLYTQIKPDPILSINQLMIEEILQLGDSSFKYMLVLFNFITIFVLYHHSRKNKPPKQHHILFITANLGEEATIFRPTITNLRQDYYVHLLCLSNGSSKQDEKELDAACQNLGIHKWQCICSQKLKNGIAQQWDNNQVRKHALKYIAENQIRAVFTFDLYGISSGNINQVSIGKALIGIKSKMLESQRVKKIKESPEQAPKQIKLYSLESVNTLRKYSGVLEAIISIFRDYSWLDLNIFRAWQSVSLYESRRFGWIQKLGILFNRYTYMNTYQRSFINVSGNDKEV